MNDNEIMENIVEAIINRTDGKWGNFTLSDKMILKAFYTQMLEEIEKCKPIMEFWKGLDVESEILNEKNSEIGKLNWLINN